MDSLLGFVRRSHAEVERIDGLLGCWGDAPIVLPIILTDSVMVCHMFRPSKEEGNLGFPKMKVPQNQGFQYYIYIHIHKIQFWMIWGNCNSSTLPSREVLEAVSDEPEIPLEEIHKEKKAAACCGFRLMKPW